MAREPIRAQAQEPDYGEDEDEVVQPGGEGEDGEGGEGEAAEDAALDPGEEQEVGSEEPVEPVREPRIQRLARENAELKRRLDGLERRPVQPVHQGPQEETDEQFQARIQLLPPDERMEARYERSERRNQQRLNAMQVHSTLTADKIAFDSKAASDSRYKRYAEAVEAKHAELLQQGQMVPREALLKFIIGERILNNQGTKEVTRQRAKGAQRVQSQQTRPAGGRSDVRGEGRRPANEAEARRKRLDGMQI